MTEKNKTHIYGNNTYKTYIGVFYTINYSDFKQ